MCYSAMNILDVRSVARHTLGRLGRLYPLPSGQHRLSSTKIVRWACKGATVVQCGTKGENFLLVDLQDAHGRSPYLFGFNDGKVRDAFRRILRTGDNAIDIGANYGAFAVLAASIVGPSGMVHAFEPQQHQAQLLEQSAALNGFGHLYVHQVALSDVTRQTKMYVFGPDTGFTSFTNPGEGHPRTTFDVIAVRADDELEKLGFQSVRLLKIDVEKHEEQVFRGAQKFLLGTPPDYILFEYFPHTTPFWSSGLVELMQNAGYNQFYEIPRTLLRTRFARLAPNEPPQRLSENFIAQHSSVDERLFD